jgi:MYXO-CTERM domain-containing protein
MSIFSRLAAAGLLSSVLSIAPVYAQQDTATSNATTPNTGAATVTTGTGTVTRYDDQRGFDWGWVGLLGLLGLLGLRKPTNLVYRERDRTAGTGTLRG